MLHHTPRRRTSHARLADCRLLYHRRNTSYSCRALKLLRLRSPQPSPCIQGCSRTCRTPSRAGQDCRVCPSFLTRHSHPRGHQRFSDVDSPNLLLDTSFNDVFSERMEEVSAALRPLVVQSGCPFATGVVTLGDLFREVVPVLFQSVAGVQVGFLGTVCDCRKVADTEVDARCFVAGCGRRLDFVFADEMEFPSLLRRVVDGPDLLEVLDFYAGPSFVLDKHVLPRFRVFFVICAFREADTVVFGVVFDAVLLPRHRRTRVFFVDAAALVVVVVFLAVAGWIRSIIGCSLTVPRVEGFSEFFQNALTGLAMQSFVFGVSLQLVFEVAVVGYLTRFLPDLSEVVVSDVPELAGRPSVPVKRFCYL